MTIPLEGSRISVDYDKGYERVSIPHQSSGIMKYLVACFLVFWLGGWAMGWKSAFSSIVKREGSGGLFLIFWLGGWTIGGIFALFVLYRIIQRPVAETLYLSRPHVIHDSGVAPFTPSFSMKSQGEFWSNVLTRRVRHEFTPEEMKTITLREHENGNRLTLDKGSKRIELAKGATDPEREWLFQLIKKEYAS
jgi:hypothetical protein